MLKWIMKPLKRFLSALFIPPKWLTDIQTDRHNEVKCAIERSVRWKISNDALWQIGGTQNFVYWVKRVNDFVKRNSQTCRSFSSKEGHVFICYYCIFWLGRYKTNVTLMNWHSEWYFFSVFRGWGGVCVGGEATSQLSAMSWNICQIYFMLSNMPLPLVIQTTRKVFHCLGWQFSHFFVTLFCDTYSWHFVFENFPEECFHTFWQALIMTSQKQKCT